MNSPYDIVEAEGSHFGDNWNYYHVSYDPGDDWRDSCTEFVRRLVSPRVPRGEYDY